MDELGERKAAEALRSPLCLAAGAVPIHGAVPQEGQLLGDLTYIFLSKKKAFCSTLCAGGLVLYQLHCKSP